MVENRAEEHHLIMSKLDGLKEVMTLRFDKVEDNQAILTERINKRESEYETLRAEHHELKNDVVALKAAKAQNKWWLTAVGILAAGLGALLGKVI